VSAAAKRLGVPVHDLRLLTRARPKLMEAAFEAVERSLDEAEAIVSEAMRNGDARQRIAAAGYFLRVSLAGRRRGWGRVGRRMCRSSRKRLRSNGSTNVKPKDVAPRRRE
jgi:hypothetical protein